MDGLGIEAASTVLLETQEPPKKTKKKSGIITILCLKKTFIIFNYPIHSPIYLSRASIISHSKSLFLGTNTWSLGHASTKE